MSRIEIREVTGDAPGERGQPDVADAGCGQLDSQGHPIQARTQIDDDLPFFIGEVEARRCLLGPRQEETDSGSLLEAGNGEQLLTGDREGTAAGGDDREARARPEEVLGQRSHDVLDVLAVVDRQELAPWPEIVDEHRAGFAGTASDPDGTGHGVHDLDRRPGAGKVCEGGTAVQRSRERRDEFLGQPGLATATRSRDRYKSTSGDEPA